MQSPVVDSGGDAPPYGGQAPAYTGTSVVASNNYPTTNIGANPAYTGASGTSTSGYSGNLPASGTGQSLADGAGSYNAAAQQGAYDPNAYAATPPQYTAQTAVDGGNRYASTGGGYETYGGGGSAGATGATDSVSWPPQNSASSQGVASANSTYGASGTTSPSYGATYGGSEYNVSQVAGAYSDGTDTTGYSAGQGDSVGRYDASTTYGQNVQTAGVGSSYPATPYEGGSRAAGLASTAPTTPRTPYRPAGTSDYVPPGESSPISVASRQPVEDRAPAAGNAAVPGGASQYNYETVPNYEQPGMGRRY